MITKTRFDQIHEEVRLAVEELFDHVKECNEDKYVLFLADAEYKPTYHGTRLSPYVISNMEDYYKEAARLEFSQYFLNNNYGLGPNLQKTTDNPTKMNIELMVYCHIWESNKFLKQLFRLLEIGNNKSYPWHVDKIPEYGKHNFIRQQIRDGFQKLGLKIADVMSKGFRTSLRNSFVHGEFDINDTTLEMTLHTYKRPRIIQTHELDKINADQWTEFFIYSAMLNYLLITEKDKRKRNIAAELGKDEFLVLHPRTQRGVGTRKIYYDSSRNNFSFHKSSQPYVGAVPGQGGAIAVPPRPPLFITPQELAQMENDASAAIVQLLDRIAAISTEEYTAFIFDIAPDDNNKLFIPAGTPEQTRLKFSAMFLEVTYFKPDPNNWFPEMIRIQMEMLIYCHIWESKVFLKQLRTGIDIIERAAVNRTYSFPDDRRTFTDDLVARYKAQQLNIGNLVEFAFHTSLRNAFAHSDYDIYKTEIYLDTFKNNEPWDIPSIDFRNWTLKFLMSALLDHYFCLEKDKRKAKMPASAAQATLTALLQKKKTVKS